MYTPNIVKYANCRLQMSAIETELLLFIKLASPNAVMSTYKFVIQSKFWNEMLECK